jgi:hypothetical protein
MFAFIGESFVRGVLFRGGMVSEQVYIELLQSSIKLAAVPLVEIFISLCNCSTFLSPLLQPFNKGTSGDIWQSLGGALC